MGHRTDGPAGWSQNRTWSRLSRQCSMGTGRSEAWAIGMVRQSAFGLLGLTLLVCFQCDASSRDGGQPARLAEQQLLGAWRLVAIEFAGPGKETIDPFYQAGSSGMIIYDPSGWMSVQISAPNRRSWEVPPVRVPMAAGTSDRLKAKAFDTYYAYIGTWHYDAATSVMTHHLKWSLVPAEAALSYDQIVTLENGRLVFTTRSGSAGVQTVRKKIWERVSAGNQGM